MANFVNHPRDVRVHARGENITIKIAVGSCKRKTGRHSAEPTNYLLSPNQMANYSVRPTKLLEEPNNRVYRINDWFIYKSKNTFIWM